MPEVAWHLCVCHRAVILRTLSHAEPSPAESRGEQGVTCCPQVAGEAGPAVAHASTPRQVTAWGRGLSLGVFAQKHLYMPLSNGDGSGYDKQLTKESGYFIFHHIRYPSVGWPPASCSRSH